jgi:hypothetical protein
VTAAMGTGTGRRRARGGGDGHGGDGRGHGARGKAGVTGNGGAGTGLGRHDARRRGSAAALAEFRQPDGVVALAPFVFVGISAKCCCGAWLAPG